MGSSESPGRRAGRYSAPAGNAGAPGGKHIGRVRSRRGFAAQRKGALRSLEAGAVLRAKINLMPIPVALTIAGSDPSGGAGIQADLKTFHQFQVYGTSAITLVTVQITVGVTRVELLPPDLILEQIGAVLSDLPVAAIKTGALGGTAAIEALATLDFPCPLVVGPVMISKHGAPLMGEDARAAFGRLLLPKASLITPNLHE